jgi:uncharacterized damage-inducible protein DinB
MNRQRYAQLFEIKRSASRALYETLSSQDRLSEVDMGLARQVLDHIQAVDRIFQHHLQGLPHDYRAARSEVIPDLDTLGRGAREVDEWYESYVAGLADQELEDVIDVVFTSGKSARMRRSEILLHVCLHGTYHRGNVGALLQLRGLTPSRDTITEFLEEPA